MVMDEEVNITSVTIVGHLECGNSSKEYAFFSNKGVVRLEISNIPVNKVLYSIVTSVTGNKQEVLPLTNRLSAVAQELKEVVWGYRDRSIRK